MLKILIITLFSFISFSSVAANKSFPSFTKKELQNMSPLKLKSIYNEYQKFLIRAERNSGYPKQIPSKKDLLKKFSEVFTLIDSAYAFDGAPCYYGGYKSIISKGECVSPISSRVSGYKRGTCSAWQFHCNPTLYKENTCISGINSYSNIAGQCLKRGKLSPEELIEREKDNKFSDFMREVDQYCSQLSIDGTEECQILKDSLSKIKKEKEEPVDQKKVMQEVTSSLEKVQSSTEVPKGCFATTDKKYCPEANTDSLDSLYASGIIGFFTGDTPRKKCSDKLPKGIDQKKLLKELKERYPHDFVLTDFAKSCLSKAHDEVDSDYEKTDKELAPSYMMVDYNVKADKIQNAINDLLDSKDVINATLGDQSMNCEDQTTKRNAERCLEIKGCSLGNQNELFDRKLTDIEMAIKSIQQLQEEINTLASSYSSSRLSYNTNNYKKEAKRRELAKNIQNILDNNPILRGKHFNSIINANKKKSYGGYSYKTPLPNREDMRIALKKQMKDTRSHINDMVSDYQNALACLQGDSDDDCDEVEDIVRRTDYRSKFKDEIDENSQLSKLINFHECSQEEKHKRDDADDLIIDIGASIALSFTPFAALNAIRVAATAGKLLATTARTASVATKAATLSADVAYTADQTSQVYKACQNSQANYLQTTTTQSQRSLSCDERKKQSIAATNLNRCSSSAILTAAIGAPVAISGFKLLDVDTFTDVAKVATRKSEVPLITDQATKGIVNGAGKEIKASTTKLPAVKTDPKPPAKVETTSVSPKAEAKTGEIVTDTPAIYKQKEGIELSPIQGEAKVVQERRQIGKTPVEGAYDIRKPLLLESPKGTAVIPVDTKKLPATLSKDVSTSRTVTGELMPEQVKIGLKREGIEKAPIEGQFKRIDDDALISQKGTQIVPAQSKELVKATSTDVVPKKVLTGELMPEQVKIGVKREAIEKAPIEGKFTRVDDNKISAPVPKIENTPTPTNKKALSLTRTTASAPKKIREISAPVKPTKPSSTVKGYQQRTAAALRLGFTGAANAQQAQYPVRAPLKEGFRSEKPDANDFEIDYAVDYSNLGFGRVVATAIKKPEGSTPVFYIGCHPDKDAQCESGIKLIPLDAVNELKGTIFARAIKGGKVVATASMNYSLNSAADAIVSEVIVEPMEGKPSREEDNTPSNDDGEKNTLKFSLKVTKTTDKYYELEVVKSKELKEDHVWSCVPEKLCKENKGKKKLKFPRKEKTYRVKVSQLFPGDKEPRSLTKDIRKCDSEACLFQDQALPGFLPPTGTNTPGQIQMPTPKKLNILINQGFN
ncbi:hypothetical protein HBN50_17380 [Halobacteriovorax sp. GB3]|uniref:hypothetical protein n=1 Tax=Halobacteriovorax sp. GB3 TaxID=2719615 RepID=UPI00235F4F1D|nr:hypothetical protein [Halobacteriovorax sp. GB3]MDD0854878.1 hypothetical protein [Halobacteriovorax sp. GB3]